MDIDAIFDAASLGESVLAYMGVMESEEQAALQILQQLADSELAAGINALEQAHRSESETTFLLREARNRFNKAVFLEKGLRQAHAYFGLAVCHSNLGDGENAWVALNDLLGVRVDHYSKTFGFLKSVGTATIGTLAGTFIGFGTVGGVAGYKYGQKLAHADLQRVTDERRALAQLKRSAWRYLHRRETGEERGAVCDSALALPLPTERIEVDCPACGQTARVPTGLGCLRVTCPRCQTRFEAET